jgi:TPR repeat protein/predicted Ser/Thr protein kinase
MEPHRLALPAGYRLENYEIQGVLGKGGFGITYVAFDWTLGCHFAIKELLPDSIATRIDGSSVVAMGPSQEESWEWARERFIEEAQTLAVLRHPNIIAVHRLIEANGTVYLVMDYLEGKSYELYLQSVVRELDEPALMATIGPLIAGMKAIHARGLLHRDIKPDNILLTGDGKPVLIDFGNARELVGKTVTMTSIVTHGYSPIEQYQTKGRMGPWTDIYAVAALMCRAITGEKPPVASDRVLDDEFEWLSNRTIKGYSQEFLRAIDWALRVRPEERPSDLTVWLESGVGNHDPTPAALSDLHPMEAPAENETLTKLRVSAEGGNVLAQFTLGVMFDTGDQVEHDPAQAAIWYHMAAQQGHAKAQNNLACLYANGEGVKKNPKEALRLYLLAAAAGSPTAESNLAAMYLLGAGVLKNTKKAEELYRKAAQNGDVEAQHSLAMIHFKGDGVRPNSREAFKWFYTAATRGFAKSQYFLAICYLEGRGARRDYRRSMKWLHEAAKQGDTNALQNIGWMHRNGVGVEVDLAKAKYYFDKAAAARAAGLRGMTVQQKI